MRIIHENHDHTISSQQTTASMDERTSSCSFRFLSALFLCMSLQFHVSVGADTIFANQTLSGDQTIVSAGGVFRLGFFSPGNSSNFYIGMWYDYAIVSEQTIVWVANRERPVTDKHSSVLKISDGNLVLFDKFQVQIWSTNVSTAVRGAVVQAVLQDDGNLVLTDGLNSSSTPLWQSFDFPTDTFLPGNKIRLNKLTGENQRLTSWKNSEDPSPGLFSVEVDPEEGNSYIIMWNQSKKYWSSGPWNGQIFSGIPEMRLNYIYNFSFIDNKNESYITYSLYNSSIVSRYIMDTSGQIRQLSWLENTKQWVLFWAQPRQHCDVYAYCGPFGSCNEKSLPFCQCMQGFEPASRKHWDLKDYSGGCKRKTDIQCSSSSLPNGSSDKFAPNPNMKLGENPLSIAAGSIRECESTCLTDCSCTAYAFENNQCSIWKENLLNLQQLSDADNEGKTLYLRLAVTEITTKFSNNNKNNRTAIIAPVLGLLGILLLFGFLLFFYVRRRKRRMLTVNAAEGTLLAFRYRELQTATKNFSERLGGGGFGSVFKGTLPDSSEVAVNKLESINQGEKEIRTVVSTIGTVQHVNLVRLRGFCSEGSKKLLVYDYMPNGSLDSHLFNQTGPEILDWKTRYHIALGTARGLAYLHEECRECIIHCNIKPEKILLDSQLCPKVAHFGLAKLMGRDFSRVLMTMIGTRGHLAPEWTSGIATTAKADVYSYGMMLFEIVSGRRNNELSEDGKVKFFPALAASILTQGGDIMSVIDSRLKEDYADAEEVARVCKVACWCIQDEENHRLSMRQVVQVLEGLLDVKMPPFPRSIQMFVENQESVVFSSQSPRVHSHAESSSSHSSRVQSQIELSSSQSSGVQNRTTSNSSSKAKSKSTSDSSWLLS